MSSSSSNAAARRRRAAPPPVQNAGRPMPGSGLVNANVRVPPTMVNPQFAAPPQQQTAPQSQNVTQSQQQTAPQQARPPMTPAQMLISHEQRLSEVENSFPDMINRIMHDVGREIESLKAGQRVQPSSNEESLGHIARLEKQLKEIDIRITELTKSYRLLSDLAAETNISVLKVMNSPMKGVCKCVDGCQAAKESVQSDESGEQSSDVTVFRHSIPDDTTELEDVADTPQDDQEETDSGIELDIQPLHDGEDAFADQEEMDGVGSAFNEDEEEEAGSD